MSIVDRLESLARQDRGQPVTVTVEWEQYNRPALTKINEALRRASEEDRFSLAVDLFTLWVAWRKDDNEAKSVFGEVFLTNHCDDRLLFTVTADNQQLRVWFGRPACMMPNHVDSCGKNLLFGVYGHPTLVEKYLKAFLEIYKIQEVKIPNGCRLFTYWSFN